MLGVFYKGAYLCPKCKKGFPRLAMAAKEGKEFYHLDCIDEKSKIRPDRNQKS